MIIGKILKNTIKDKLRDLKPGDNNSPRAAIIFGGGSPNGIGGAVAQRIAKEGVKVYITGRSQEKLEKTVSQIDSCGFNADYIVVDAAEEQEIVEAFRKVHQDGFAIDLVVHNVGTNIPCNFLDITAAYLEKSWRADCLSGFYVGQQAIKYMQPNGRGTIIFTGASASIQGKAGFAAFTAAKSGLRSLTQSMAREFGPKGIHVAHVVIDGMVDGDRLRTFLPDILDSRGEDGSLDPREVAENYWQIYQQHKTTWTQEIDLRPFKENW